MAHDIDDLIYEILAEGEPTVEEDDIEVRNYRDTLEIQCPGLRTFVRVTSAFQIRGWISTDIQYVQRLLVGVSFDTEPRVVIAISLHSLAKWSSRYQDGKNRTPVLALRAACNQIVHGKVGNTVARATAAIAVERQLYGV
jgi:hypothetical protein